MVQTSVVKTSPWTAGMIGKEFTLHETILHKPINKLKGQKIHSPFKRFQSLFILTKTLL